MFKTAFPIAALALLTAATVVQAQERQWSLDASAEDAFLVFGVPETDDVGLSFWCKIGSGTAMMFYPVPWTDLVDNSTIRVRVEVGPTKLNLKGKATARFGAGVASLEVSLEPDSALFGAIRGNDRIIVKLKGHKATYPLQGADVDGLLRLCRRT